jgi:hypothetical protein
MSDTTDANESTDKIAMSSEKISLSTSSSETRMLRRKMTVEEERIGNYFRQTQKVDVPWPTHLEHLCHLNVNEPPQMIRKTGIICTIGLLELYLDQCLFRSGMCKC